MEYLAPSPIKRIRDIGWGDISILILVSLGILGFSICSLGVWFDLGQIVSHYDPNLAQSSKSASIWVRNFILFTETMLLIAAICLIARARIKNYIQSKDDEDEDILPSLKDWLPEKLLNWSRGEAPPTLCYNDSRSTACYSTLDRAGRPAIVVGTGLANKPRNEALFLVAHEFSHCEIEHKNRLPLWKISRSIPVEHLIRTCVYFLTAFSIFNSITFFTFVIFLPNNSIKAYGGTIAILAIIPAIANLILASSVLIKNEFLHDLRAAQITGDAKTGIDLLNRTANPAISILSSIKQSIVHFIKFHPPDQARILSLLRGDFLRLNIVLTPYAVGAALFLLALNVGLFSLFFENESHSQKGAISLASILLVLIFVLIARGHCIVIALRAKRELNKGRKIYSCFSTAFQLLLYSCGLFAGFLTPVAIVLISGLRELVISSLPADVRSQNIGEPLLKLGINLVSIFAILLMMFVAALLVRIEKKPNIWYRLTEITVMFLFSIAIFECLMRDPRQMMLGEVFSHVGFVCVAFVVLSVVVNTLRVDIGKDIYSLNL